MPPLSARIDAARARLEAAGQLHLLNFAASLESSGQEALVSQIESLDLAALPGLIQTYVKSKPAAAMPRSLGPAPYYPVDRASALRSWDRSRFQHLGEALLRGGKIAAFVVAGGQGSRLGFEGPKGCFPAGAVTGKSLFQIFAENMLGAKDRYGVRVPWYIMTSPLNHKATVEFFGAHDYFSLSREDVRFFPQGVMPSLDIATGKVLLTSKGEVATNPDGHGGCVRALHQSGALADMKSRGITQVSYFQVDNPNVRILDPIFLGLHANASDSSGEMSSKMVAKANPGEKVGVFCLADGKIEVLEYSDLPRGLAEETHADGSLRYNAGSVAIHALGVEFIERLATDTRFALPFHRAEKKVSCIDAASGASINPLANNAMKLEKFVFDALALCKASIVVETDRIEEFAPIKNATGSDSVETCQQIQTRRSAKWLLACGVDVPMQADGVTPDCVIEISPRTATCAEELKAARLPGSIQRNARITL